MGPGREDQVRFIQLALPLILYICTQNDVSGHDDRLPARELPFRRVKKRKVFTAPKRETTWDVGVKMGGALRRAYAAEQSAPQGGTKRPHIRRAHWHTFLTGPRIDEQGNPIAAENRERKVQWIPPIAVNKDDLSDANPLPATIWSIEQSA